MTLGEHEDWLLQSITTNSNVYRFLLSIKNKSVR